MKNLVDWDENYIIELASGHELDAFEFKGRPEIDLTLPGVRDIRRENLAKAISALVNFGGGILILGINNLSKSIDDGGIDLNIRGGTKEWLENILPALVDPPLPKLNIYEVRGFSKESLIHSGRAVYVVEIKESPLAPHQSIHDHVYYGRAGARSIPLGNRLVLDIINRRQFPDLTISFAFAQLKITDPKLMELNGISKYLYVQIQNNGPIYAKYVNSILYVPKYLIVPQAIHNFLNGAPVELEDGVTYIKIIRENIVDQIYSGRMEMIGRDSGRYFPILPGRHFSWPIPLVDNLNDHIQFFSDNKPIIRWELYGDNSPCKKGVTNMKDTHIMKNSLELR